MFLSAAPAPTAPPLRHASGARTVLRRAVPVASDDDEPEPTGSASTSTQDVLQVPDSPAPFDMVAYYESLLLPVSLIPEPPLSPSPFSPPRPNPFDIAMLFLEDDVGGLDLDLPALVRLYRPLVHPDHVEYTINRDTGLRTVRHTFVNLAILEDWMLARSDVRRALNLAP